MDRLALKNEYPHLHVFEATATRDSHFGQFFTIVLLRTILPLFLLLLLSSFYTAFKVMKNKNGPRIGD